MTLPEHTATPTTPQPPKAPQPFDMPQPEPLTIISHAQMNDAIDARLVTPFSPTIAFIVRYQRTWWVAFEGGWIRADEPLSAMLDTDAARMTAQDVNTGHAPDLDAGEP